MRSLSFLMLAGFTLLFLMPDAMSDEGPGPQVGFAGNYDTDGHAVNVVVSGDYAYIAGGSEGLVAVNISNPANPFYAGNYDTADFAHDVAVSGDYAYIADGANGLVVVDVSDPTNLTYVDDWDKAVYYNNMYAYSVTVSDEYAYVVSGYGGLVVVDVSDPTNLTDATGLNTDSDAADVEVSGGYAYIASGNGLLVVVDVSDPTDPTYAGEYEVGGASSDVALWLSGYVYVAAGPNGLVVVDVSDPANPTYTQGYNTNDYARGVTVSGGYAYIADSANGLVVVDVNDPTNPTYMGKYDIGYARGVTVSGDYAYIADQDSGLVVVGMDSDGDTIADVADPFPSDPDEWTDSDGDGVGDNSDAFPNDLTASLDSDGDGYPDSWNSGITSSALYLDQFPFDPTEWADTDNDGVGDNDDPFPSDPTEWFDIDNDGVGDNSDAFPHDSDEQFDTDGDGVGDNSDSFPRTALFKSWWGPILLTIIAITGSISHLIARTNKGILADAEQILEELGIEGGDVAPARKAIDKARKFSWEFGYWYFGVWDPNGKVWAELARGKAGKISFEHDKIQEEIDEIDTMLKGFDKDGVDVSLSMAKMELAQTALSEGKFEEAWERLASARSIGSKLKEEYVESMKGIDRIKAKIAEFKEKGVNTDELEKILKKAEKAVEKGN